MRTNTFLHFGGNNNIADDEGDNNDEDEIEAKKASMRCKAVLYKQKAEHGDKTRIL